MKSTLNDTLAKQKQAFLNNSYPSYKERKSNLIKLKRMLLDNQDVLIDAISDDFGHRSKDDSRIGDFLSTVSGINYTLNKLKRWMKPERRHVGVLFQPATARVEYQPKGVVGIMVPWNYPIFLALGPLTQALAAGNRSMIKMSEYTPATSKLLKTLCQQYFDENLVSVIEGDASVAAAFSQLKLDHIFFTGSINVGKLVMKAASKNLVPVTLELGGKSPCIIAPNMDIETAVNRLILGKVLNSGQTCVAPDYILCPKGQSELLIKQLTKTYNSLYPSIKNNPDCTSVINEGQYDRINWLLNDAKVKGAKVTSLGIDESTPACRQMPLTIVQNTSEEMAISQEEIFGPILPIVEYKTVEQAISYINRGERPLALYIYSFDKKIQRQILQNTHSGGVCINDAAMHVAIEDLPFGGVGHSGMGSYHGVEGFKTFSHAKSIFARGRLTLAQLLFPPFGTAIHKLIYKFFIR